MPMIKLPMMPTSRVKPKEKMAPVVDSPKMMDKILLGPNTPISITATIRVVMLPSKMAQKLSEKPSFRAPSRLLPLRSSSRMRLAEITLASTPMPMESTMPAKPGRVVV